MSDRETDGGLDLPALEARWPILLAVIGIMTLTALRPPEIRVAAPWVLPAVELIFLVALVVGHPARTGPRARSLRTVSIIVVSVVVLDTLAATVRLINVLVNGGQATNSAQELLAVGGLIWVSNVIAFALLYWLLDSGGAAVRAERGVSTPDL